MNNRRIPPADLDQLEVMLQRHACRTLVEEMRTEITVSGRRRYLRERRMTRLRYVVAASLILILAPGLTAAATAFPSEAMDVTGIDRQAAVEMSNLLISSL